MEIPPLFERLPADWDEAVDPAAPWTLLEAPLSSALSDLPDEYLAGWLEPGVHLSGNGIVIEKGARVRAGATIEGPAFIGPNCDVRPGAYLRGGVWLEANCIVGANSEIKHAILLEGARTPHLNYVGDSILGAGVNLGAGTILSNFRQDGHEIVIPGGEEKIATGVRKLGAILGDGVRTGCNCVLHPGVIVGAGTVTYPGVHLRPGVYGANLIIKLRQTLEIVERR